MILTKYQQSLVDLVIPADEHDTIINYAKELPSLTISHRSRYDLEMLANGAFSPLDGFMKQADYESVLDTMRLQDGTLFPMPVTLAIADDIPLKLGTDIALRTRRNYLLAIMTLEEIYEWDKSRYIQQILADEQHNHPLIQEIQKWGHLHIAGKLRVLQLPPHYDFPKLRRKPAQIQQIMVEKQRGNIISFQTRTPMNRAQETMLKQAMNDFDASLLIQPIVGLTLADDVDHYTRVRANTTMIENYFDKDQVDIALLPFSMRMTGKREALLQTIIARNYGATHIPIGRDHASIHSHNTYTAQSIAQSYEDEIGIKILPYQEWVYLPENDRYEDSATLADNQQIIRLSTRAIKCGYLDKGKKAPAWFVRPEVAEILAQTFPSKKEQGICIWLTGLSGSGKSTTASILSSMLRAYGRQITLLDGDIVRMNLSKGLRFSKEDRDINIRRIGFVSAEIVKHGGIAICATISPYQAVRTDVRNLIGNGFIEVFVDTPLEVCEQRDTKGLYAKARRGQIKGFTGIDDPYEPPQNPEIHLKTMINTPHENAEVILSYLIKQDFIK